jgi:predicted nucleic acid-binding protein
MVTFDSSIVIEALNKRKGAVELISSYSANSQIAITAITKYEILRGTKEKNLSLVSEFLSQFIIYDFENNAIAETVKIYEKLKTKGCLINEFDMIIAGIAAANDEILITRDQDFSKLESPKIIILR